MKIYTKYAGDIGRQSTTLTEPTILHTDNAYDYDSNRTFAQKEILIIPYNTQKAPNGEDNWVYFDLETEEWIYDWLDRIVLEYTHKQTTFPTAMSYLTKTMNKHGTYDRLNSFNTPLTTAAGLVLNRRRATEIKFSTKQLADLEKVFDIATYVLTDTWAKNHITGKTEHRVLTTKDIGYHRTTKEPNKDISRIYFAKNTKLTIAANGEVYDNTPEELVIGA